MTRKKPRKRSQSNKVELTKKLPRIGDIDRIVDNADVSTNIDHVIDTIDLSERPTSFEPVHIDQHNILLTEQTEFFERFNANNELASLLFVNPVLAFREAGITMSPEIARHVLRSVYQPKRVRDRIAELVTGLKEELGELPRPHDPAWAASFLFETLKLPVMNTTKLEPTYKPSRAANAIAKLNARRPKGGRRYNIPRRRHPKMLLSGPYKPPPDFRQLDLEADLPEIKTTRRKRTNITFEELYFYKDSHPLVKDVLEYGMLSRRGLPMHSGDSFRKIQAGEKVHLFHSWIKSVRFSSKEPRDEPDS